MTPRGRHVAPLLALLLTACDRPPAPPPPSASAGAPPAAPATAAPAAPAAAATATAPAPSNVPRAATHRATAVTTTGPQWVLRDYAAVPEIDPAECAAPAPRLLSAAPNVTELCCALGLRDALVGRTRYCTYPPDVATIPAVGALNDLNAEVLAGLKPELVLVSGTSRAIRDRLMQLGLRFESLPDVGLDDLFASIRRLGELTGRHRTAAALAAALRADLAVVTARYAAAPPRRVLLLTGPLPDPPTQIDAAGPGSFYDDLLRLAGHRNAAAATARPFAPLGLEAVVAADPDVIIELAPDHWARPGGDADACRAWARVGRLRAVATRRVHVLVGPEHFLLGPRIAHTYAALAGLVAEGRHD